MESILAKRSRSILDNMRQWVKQEASGAGINLRTLQRACRRLNVITTYNDPAEGGAIHTWKLPDHQVYTVTEDE